MSETSERPVRFYTRARKFPRLIGQTLDGTKIPGGPYTWPQLFLAGGVLFLAIKSAPLWARGSGIQTLLVIVFVTGAALVFGRQMPQITRNPLLMVGGFSRVLFGPRHGRLQNRPVKARLPHAVKGMCLIDQRGLPAQDNLGPVETTGLLVDPLPEFDLLEVPSPLEDPVPGDEPLPPKTTNPVPLSRVAALLSQAVSGDRDA